MLDKWIDVRKKQIKEAVDPKITIKKIDELNAYFTVKEINNVDYTKIVKCKNKVILYLSKGYKILEYTPLDKFYNVRIYVNDENEIYQYYFDIIDEVKIKNGIPFYNDLYLDVAYDNDEKIKEKMHIAKNESTLRMIDEDELKEALEKGIINEKQYDKAYKTAENLMDEIKNGKNIFVNRGLKDYFKSNKLNDSQINEILVKNYNIFPTNITEINRGTADIFKIQTRGGSYILKQFSAGRESNLIEKEINVINYLKDKEISVPTYIKSNDGKFYTEFNNRIIIVQKFIDGYTVRDNSADYVRTIKCANIFGRLVEALGGYDGLSEDGIMQKSFSKEALKNGILKMKDFQKNIKIDNKYRDIFYDDMNYKIKIAQNLLDTFDFDILNKITICNTHGDYSMQQLIFCENNGMKQYSDNNTINTNSLVNGEEALEDTEDISVNTDYADDTDDAVVIDFERAKKMPIVWELMRSYTYIDKEAENGQMNLDTLKDYFTEFLRFINLNEYDLKYAPHIYLMQLVISVFGYKEYNENYEKENLLNFGFFRTNVCKYLYNNLDKISDKLTSIDING